MSLVITTAVDPSEKRLVTLSKVKARLGVTSTTDDTKLTEIIDEVSQLVCDFLGTDLAKQTYTETLAGNNRTYLLLARVPIVSITSVSYQGNAYADYSVADYNAGLLYREDGFYYQSPSISRLVHDPHPSLKAKEWVIVYEAGYTLPAGEEPDTSSEFMLPISMRAHVYDLIEFYYRSSVRDVAVKKRVDGDMQEEYFSEAELGSHGFPMNIEKGLARFKRF